MTDDELCYLSANAALQLFKARKLSPVDLLRALQHRAGRINSAINCFADQYFDEALARAKLSEQRYSKNDEAGTVDGIPLAVKDAQAVAGKRTTHGSLIFQNAAADVNSDPMIERLEKAGANIFARTTTPEFCLSGVCHSRIWGVTYNPWNLDYGPGGSSGGSGAALAAGVTTLATGTDIGGSIRIPASACGVVGFKPPHGRNPDGPPANFDRFNHCGPMTRSVSDAALMQNITSGSHPLDHDSLREKVTLPTEAAAIRGMKVAYSIDFGYVNVDPEVRQNTLEAIAIFKSLGAIVEEVDLGWTAAVDHDCMHWYNMMNFGRQAIWHQKENAHLMTDYALKFAAAALRNSNMDDIHKPWARAHAMYQTLGPVLARNQILICPTTNSPAIKALHDPADFGFTVNGVKADPEYGWVMTHQFNMLHNLPVLSVPSGFTNTQLPTGIQIVGRSFDDAEVFRAGLAYEKAVDGWYSDPAKQPNIKAPLH
jgi:Asp-tRNA(Asn)/Glu-tRNA(Gln) amidotransferase A subunit family amidase